MCTVICHPFIGFFITHHVFALNTYVSDNETYWQSTSEFIPINSSHNEFYGHIRLWEHMIMSLDIEFHSRVSPLVDGKWEQMFRLGWPAYTGDRDGALSRYPSLWLDNAANVFHFSLSHSDNSGWGKDFNQLTLMPQQTYSVYIEWNQTWIYFAVNGDVFWNKPRLFPTASEYIGKLLNVYIASDSPPGNQYIISDVTLRNILIQTTPPTASPTTDTTVPTPNPSKTPTLSTYIPTHDPTTVPTAHPTQATTTHPTGNPTAYPTTNPSAHPSHHPTLHPLTASPTMLPTISPTIDPTVNPTPFPTIHPSHNPTHVPSTINPSIHPSFSPSIHPVLTFTPTVNPTSTPSHVPTRIPSLDPTQNPVERTSNSTHTPTVNPTSNPTHTPTVNPTSNPTHTPTTNPTSNPSSNPTATPSIVPTASPISNPTLHPTEDPTVSSTTEHTLETTTSRSPSISPTASAILSTDNIMIHEIQTDVPPQGVLDNVDSNDLIYLAVAGCVGCLLCAFMTLIIVNSTKKTKLTVPKQNEMVRKNQKDSPYFPSSLRDKTPTSQYMDQTKPVRESDDYDAYGFTKEEMEEIRSGMDDDDETETGDEEDGENVSATSNVRDHETETEMETELDYDYEDAYEYALEHEDIPNTIEYEDDDPIEPGIDGMNPYETVLSPEPLEIPQPPQIIIKRKYCMSEELEEEYLKRVMNEVVVVPINKKRSPPPQHALGFVGIVSDDHKMAEIIDDNDSEIDTLTVPTIPDVRSIRTNTMDRMDEESITMLEAGYEWITLVFLEIDAIHWKEYVDNFKHHHVTEARLAHLNAEDLKRLIPNHETRNEFQMLLINKLGTYHD